MSISCSCLDLKNSVIDRKKRNIESSTSKIEDKHVSFSHSLLIQSICNSSSRGFVDDSQNVKSSNSSSVLGSLSLAVVEVSRHSNNCVLDLSSQVSLCSLFHLGQDHGWDLLRMEFLLFSFVLHHYHRLIIHSTLNLKRPMLHILLNNWIIEFPSDQSLGIKHSIVWILSNLVLSRVSNQSLAFREGNIRRSSSVSLIIGDDFHSVVLPHSHTGVSGSQVNSDSFVWDVSHVLMFVLFWIYVEGEGEYLKEMDFLELSRYSRMFWKSLWIIIYMYKGKK